MKFVGMALITTMTLVVAGCGESNPSTVSASGTVTLDGKPVEGATVIFSPESLKKGETAIAKGTTDSAGKFTLSSFGEGDGAIPGKYNVTVTKKETTGGATAEEEHDAASKGKEVPAAKVTYLVPQKYTSSTTSGLKEEVKSSGENNFELKLTSS